MNKNKSIRIIAIAVVAAMVSIAFDSCDKSTESPLPIASFTNTVLTPTSSEPHNLQLINTTETKCRFATWDISGLGLFMGDTMLITIPSAGSYDVKLTVVTHQGDADATMQTVNILEDNPYAGTRTNILGVISGYGLGDGTTSRTWIAQRIINTVIRGQDYDYCLNMINTGGWDSNDWCGAPWCGSWWAFRESDIDPVNGRNGYFDDEYTFTTDGDFAYDDNNTVFLDGCNSDWQNWNNLIPCDIGTYPSTDGSGAIYQKDTRLLPWGSGDFTYSVQLNSGAKGLGTLTVKGVGAHMGLMDKANNGTISFPEESVSYDVLRIETDIVDSATGKRCDRLILGINDWNGLWAFTFITYF